MGCKSCGGGSSFSSPRMSNPGMSVTSNRPSGSPGSSGVVQRSAMPRASGGAGFVQPTNPNPVPVDQVVSKPPRRSF